MEAQNINSQIQEIPYVFEGIIEKIELYAGDKSGNKLPESTIKKENGIDYFFQQDGSPAIGYSIATIKLCKAYKGASIISEEKLYILTSSEQLTIYKQDGQTRHMYIPSSHSTDVLYLPATIGRRSIFFCKKNEKGYLTIYNYLTGIGFNDNYISDKNTLGGNEKQIEYAMGFNKTFYSQDELNTFLSSIPTLIQNPKDKCALVEKKSLIVSENEEVVKINYQQNLENYNKWLNFTLERKNNPKSNKTSKVATTDLTLGIANPRMVGTSIAPWFEFDVLVSANTTTYFDNCLMRIQYNTSAFGSNVVAGSNILITRAAAFNNPTYTNPQADVIDQTTNTIGMPFGTDFIASSWSRTIINSTPKIMLTVRFKIQSCSQFANINFADISFTPMFSYYTINATDNIVAGINFGNTLYNGTVTDKTCEPLITSFTNNVPAGANKILTINGKYFGAYKGTGTVIFMNADKGNVYPPSWGPNSGGIQQYDVISWNHDEIKIKLPSVIDSVPDPMTSTELLPIPGSGKFKLRNQFGYIKESSTKLTIPFAIFGYAEPFPIYRKIQVKLSGQDYNGYIVHLNPNVTSTFPNAKAVIRKAMKDWSCATGINWRLGNDTTLSSAMDATSMINIGSFSALQRTINKINICPDVTGNVYYLKSFDIEIKNPFSNPIYSWQVDTTGDLQANKYDFYHGIAHELGHALLLQHANDSLGDIMFWSAWNGFYPASQRKLVWVSSGAQYGGDYVVDSLSSNLTCTGKHIYNLPANCTGVIGVKENANNQFNITLFPNPSIIGESITIKLAFDTEKSIQFKWYDVSGKLIQFTDKEKVSSEDIILSTENINAGIYLLQIIIDGKIQSVKIIKQ